MSPRFAYSADELMDAAWASTGGDPTMPHLGIHRGSPTRVDLVGLTKGQVYDAALRRDLAFFRRLRRMILSERGWLTSIRTHKRKQSGPGTRPIDDPSETKRLVCLLVARDLAVLADEHDALPTTVVGFRRIHDVRSWCPTAGATIQDQFAGAVYGLMKDEKGEVARTWIVKIDLADAFGRLPHAAIHEALRALGLDHADRRRIVDLARINCVDTSTGRRVGKHAEGVEQGNPLSSLILNLVMALAFRRMAERGVAAGTASYGDDVVLVAGSYEEAKAAFEVFLLVTAAMGFTNVRGVDHAEKPTRIIDTAVEPVELIRTFVIGAGHGIGLVPGKALEVGNDLSGLQANAPRVRKAARSMTISKRWMRRVGLIDPVSDPDTLSPSDPALGSDPTSQDPPLPCAPGSAGKREAWEGQAILAPRDEGHDEPCCASSTAGRGEVGPASSPLGDASPDARALTASVPEAVPRGALLVDGEGIHPAGAILRGGDPDREGKLERATPDGKHPGGHRCSPPTRGGSPISVCTIETIHLPPRIHPWGEENRIVSRNGRAATLSPGPVRGSAGGGGRVRSPVPSRAVPHGNLMSVLRRGERVGDRLKRLALDLRGFGDLIAGTDDSQVAIELGGLIKAVRVRSSAWVVIHPGEPWTERSTILGNSADRVYRRVRCVPVEGGVAVRLVLCRPSRGRMAPSRSGRPTVERCGRLRWRVRYDGRTVFVAVTSPVSPIARTEALLEASRLLGVDFGPREPARLRHVALARADRRH